MNLSSTKNHLIVISILNWAFACLPLKTWAAKYEYQLHFDARYGIHYYGVPNAATNRHTFEYEQKAEFNNQWSSVLGLRAEVEAAYASVPERYGTGDVAKNDSQSFFPRDSYLQYQNGVFRTRAGYQQVVWGEAFGNNYADIVNPKDYREAGLGDVARSRLNSPLLNMQWIFSNSSIQLLYLPKAGHSLLPSSGSDFNSFTLPSAFSGYSLTINREPVDSLTRGEYGLRLTQQISRLDLSLFYLNYYDRLPVYQMQISSSPQSITALPDYKRLQTAGMTFTLDVGGYLLRSEILQHADREINTSDGVTVGSARSNELIYVLGMDLPQLDSWQIGFQYSESRLSDNNWLSRTNHQTIASARIAKTFKNEIGIETLLTDFTRDSSTLAQMQLIIPISNQAEIIFGLDKFDGRETSTLGRLKNASRAWIMFKTSIKN